MLLMIVNLAAMAQSLIQQYIKSLCYNMYDPVCQDKDAPALQHFSYCQCNDFHIDVRCLCTVAMFLVMEPGFPAKEGNCQ